MILTSSDHLGNIIIKNSWSLKKLDFNDPLIPSKYPYWRCSSELYSLIVLWMLILTNTNTRDTNQISVLNLNPFNIFFAGEKDLAGTSSIPTAMIYDVFPAIGNAYPKMYVVHFYT